MAIIPLHNIKDTLKKTGKYWISFTGDSITSCEWVHPNWRDIVVYVLQTEMTTVLDGDWKLAEWGIKGFNFGYDGATTKDIVEKLDDVLLVGPQLVIGLMGGNDAPLGVSVEESVRNISAIYEKVTANEVPVIWCSSTPAGKGSDKNSEYQPYADAFKKMPEQKNFYKVNMFDLYQEFPTEKFFTFISEENLVENIKAGDPDLQHPNQLGNAYIAKVILKEVFGVEFNPEKYTRDTLNGEKLPTY